MRKKSVSCPDWSSDQAMPFGNKLSLLDFLLLDTQDQIQKGKESLYCDISKLYIGMVFKILACVPKLLKYIKMNGRQLRVRFTKGISK